MVGPAMGAGSKKTLETAALQTERSKLFYSSCRAITMTNDTDSTSNCIPQLGFVWEKGIAVLQIGISQCCMKHYEGFTRLCPSALYHLVDCPMSISRHVRYGDFTWFGQFRCQRELNRMWNRLAQGSLYATYHLNFVFTK